MARSPFQGNWQEGNRPTVVTAPDALVYVNGRPDLQVCSSCSRRFDLNKYVTSIQVDLNVDNAPGSANVNLSVPRHTLDDFFVDGMCVLTPMMEIEIYAKGYYLVGGMPQYYPIFWGLITEVSDSCSGGEHTVSINCADILKWWELCKLNITPALAHGQGQVGNDYINGSAFNGANVYDIIWTLAQQSFGDVVQATGSLVNTPREARFPSVFSGLRNDITSYWSTRFGQMRSNIMLYGMEGAAIRGDDIYASNPTGSSDISQKVATNALRNGNGGAASTQVLFDPASAIAFRSNIANSGTVNFWQSEFQTKLEIANTCKEAVGYEFYMDVTGDIVFKPPFYNMDVLSNKPVSWIQDIDIIDWTLSESESEVITQLEMSGSYEGGPSDLGATADFCTPVIKVTDYHLLRQFGWRVQAVSAEYLNNQESMFYAGLDMLDRINSRRHRSTVTIPMRPELRLGFPIYLAPKDQIWYISGISHSLTFGGRAQTQLTLTARRGKFIAPKGIGSITLTKIERTAAQQAEADKERADAKTASSVPLTVNLMPTAKEIAAFGHFSLKIGAAAETPPTNLQANTFAQDPYEPLVLRHPKTGRIVGFPNVNMTYTRPFTDAKALERAAGRNTSGKRKAADSLSGAKNPVAAQVNSELIASNLLQNETRNLINKHLDNRYIYGMTSAGVYTYVHDQGRAGDSKRKPVIQEIIQLPITSITVSSETGASLDGTNGTATIRPVSDERGFEVIGHYRYGRGISLRDGCLVLTNDGRTKKALVETQLALSGGLFETLQAQVQGLTTLSTSYGNPADVIARMNMNDSQTAGMINPETGKPAFVDNGSNFIDSAPLGSPANQGQVASVEASQLSRALTIAEMRMKDEGTPTDPNCACLLGRSDLAFINVGYQVKFLDGIAPDNSSTARSAVLREVADLNQRFNVLQSKKDAAGNDPLLDFVGEVEFLAKVDAEQAVIQRRLEELHEVLGSDGSVTGEDPVSAVLSNLDVNSPVAMSTSVGVGMTIKKVETFLRNLYEVLDAPHQAYEDALRGKLIPSPTREALLSANDAVNNPRPSPYSPPFSASGRAVGGDPRALALQGSSARTNLVQSWKDFGENLRGNAERAVLIRHIDSAKDTLRRLEAEEEELKDIKSSGSILVGRNVTKRLESVQEQRSKASQQLQNAEAKLQQLGGVL